MNAIKFKKLNEDNVDSLGIQDILVDILKKVDLGIDEHSTVDELEYLRRDGFIPSRHNCGGADYIGMINIGYLINSQYHNGTKIEEYVDKIDTETRESVLLENRDVKEGGDRFYSILDESFDNECSYVAFRIRIMYEGEGVMKVYSGWDTDAPYFRWSNSADLEQTINFRTISGLKRKLKIAIDKAIKNI